MLGDGPAGRGPGWPGGGRPRAVELGERVREARAPGRGLEATGDRGWSCLPPGELPAPARELGFPSAKSWFPFGKSDAPLGTGGDSSPRCWGPPRITGVTPPGPQGPSARRPFLTVAPVLERKVIVLEVGGAGVLLRLKNAVHSRFF